LYEEQLIRNILSGHHSKDHSRDVKAEKSNEPPNLVIYNKETTHFWPESFLIFSQKAHAKGCFSLNLYRVDEIAWSISNLTLDSGEIWRFPWRFVVLMSIAGGYPIIPN
jgi:hypothetical protein